MRIKSKLWLIALLLTVTSAVQAKVMPFGKQVKAGTNTVFVQFYSPSIVRVSVAPQAVKTFDRKSYSVILNPGSHVSEPVGVKEGAGETVLKYGNIEVSVNTATGYITFADARGNTLMKTEGSTISPCQHAVDAGKYKVSQTFRLDPDEAIYGLGQLRDTAMNQRGRHVEIWNHNTYISIPYFTSEKGYGLYWDNAGKSYFDDSAKGTTFSSEVAPYIDYYFLYRDGTQDGVVSAIRELTGKATMFPLWTLGFWQCRERYKTSDELAAVLDKYRELRIPTDAMVQDWQYWGCDSNWNAMRFMNPYYINKVGDKAWDKYLPGDMRNLPTQQMPRLKSPEEMVSYVHQNHAHLMISIWASFGPWTEQYKKLKAINALLPFDTWPRNQGVLPYDVFNPQARNIYWQYLSYLYKMGLDAWWTDSTEPDHFERPGDDNYMTFDGSWRSVKNAFPLLHNKGIYEHQRAMKGNAKRSFQMTRSGAFGLQHYGTLSWSGDIVASWDEMKNQIPSGLNYTLCGIPFWNTDLGGFFYWEYEQDPQNPAIQELQTRWMQWGTFMPLMRNHCSSPMVSELYRFGKEGDWAYDAMKKAIEERYRLLPYIYSNAADCALNDGSMMRALVMDFAADKRAAKLNTEYMFGRNLLVRPVTDPMYTWKDQQKKGHLIYPDVKRAAAPTTVYLPKGTKWYDFWDNTCLEGGQEVQRLCPIDIIPVYVKAGTILPIGPDVQYSNEKPWDELEVRVYTGADGTFTLYEDEGDSYNYEKGKYTLIRFDYDDARRTLTIQPRKGSYKGMIAHRKFNLKLIVDGAKAMGGTDAAPSKTVEYSGGKLTVQL
jgi:alpha-D-xyloside xylohydrolase